MYGGHFVDLYLRCTNSIAIDLGSRLQRLPSVREYYGSFGLGPGSKDEEDTFGPFSLSFIPLLDLAEKEFEF